MRIFRTTASERQALACVLLLLAAAGLLFFWRSL